jgi:hypothetical protein
VQRSPSAEAFRQALSFERPCGHWRRTSAMCGEGTAGA